MAFRALDGSAAVAPVATTTPTVAAPVQAPTQSTSEPSTPGFRTLGTPAPVKPVAPVQTPEPNFLQKGLGLFLDPIIETGVRAGQAAGALALKGANVVTGGALDKYAKGGSIDTAISEYEKKPTVAPITGSKIMPIAEETPGTVAGRALKTVALGAGSPAAAGAEYGAGSALQEKGSATDVAVKTVVGAIAGKILEHGFNAVAPYVEKAAGKYGAPFLDQVSQYVPDSAKEFMDNLASKVPNTPELPQVASDLIQKGQDAADTAFNAPFRKAADAMAGLAGKTNLVTRTPEEVAGRVVQGDAEDAKAAAQVLARVDTTGIGTYKQLSDRIGQSIKTDLGNVTAEFGKKTDTMTIDSFKQTVTGSSGGTTEKADINYVREALDNLKELYSKTKDVPSLTRITALIKRGDSEGLTATDVNNIAKEYGTEFGSKAFSARTGDPLTSVNAQAYENIRSGVKDSARSLLESDQARTLDKGVSQAIRVKKLVDDMATKVQKLEQRVVSRNIVEKVARGLGQAVDVLTLGGPRAFVQKLFFPSNVGLKTLNSIDLEKMLSGNLDTIDALLKLREADLVRVFTKIVGGETQPETGTLKYTEKPAGDVSPETKPETKNVPKEP